MTAATASTSQAPVAHEQVGYVFPVWRSGIGRARQAGYHAALNMDGAAYARFADVSLLGNDCLHGARPVDNLGRKRLHFGVRLRQAEPVLVDEPLDVKATVIGLARQKRGELINIDFAFARPDGTVPVRIDHLSLMLDEGPQPPGGTGGGVKADDDGWETLRTIPLTLPMVSGFSYEFPHLDAHHSAEAAERIGLRAAIAQGLMSFTMMTAELAKDAPPRVLDIEARFVRPVFCDETMLVQARREGGRITAMRCMKGDGKVASTAIVHALEY